MVKRRLLSFLFHYAIALGEVVQFWIFSQSHVELVRSHFLLGLQNHAMGLERTKKFTRSFAPISKTRMLSGMSEKTEKDDFFSVYAFNLKIKYRVQ